MGQKIRWFPYVLSAAVLIVFMFVSALIGWSTENTVWGMFGFLLFCLPSFFGSIYNARICRQQGRDLRFLFYVLIFVLGVWILGSILICLFALINGLPLK